MTLIEARSDVGAGTSKANTAIWHTGFDAKPGTREAGLVARGHRLLAERADAMNWPLERTGALLVAWDDEQLARLDGIVANAAAGRVPRDRAPDRRRRSTRQSRTSVTGRGADCASRTRVSSIRGRSSSDWPPTPSSTVRPCSRRHRSRRSSSGTRRTGSPPVVTCVDADWVVNAAGLNSDVVDRMLGEDGFTVTPRRGQLIVFDKLARGLLEHIILPVPTATTKGVLVSPTVYGNILLGPTAEDLPDKDATPDHPRWSRRPARHGPADPAGAARRGGHRHVRGPAGSDRALRLLPGRDRPPSDTCAWAASGRPASRPAWPSPRR